MLLGQRLYRGCVMYMSPLNPAGPQPQQARFTIGTYALHLVLDDKQDTNSNWHLVTTWRFHISEKMFSTYHHNIPTDPKLSSHQHILLISNKTGFTFSARCSFHLMNNRHFPFHLTFHFHLIRFLQSLSVHQSPRLKVLQTSTVYAMGNGD